MTGPVRPAYDVCSFCGFKTATYAEDGQKLCALCRHLPAREVLPGLKELDEFDVLMLQTMCFIGNRILYEIKRANNDSHKTRD